jgi:hypothetical protein
MFRPLFLALIILIQSIAVHAQTPVLGQMRNPAGEARYLNIHILEGDNAVNSALTGTSTSPVVEVRDSRSNLPVEGAEVTFELPRTGPGGTFPGGEYTYTKTTNAQGQVRAPLFVSPEVGAFEIKVRATHQGASGQATIRQTTTSMTVDQFEKKANSRWYKSWKFWFATGALAAGGVTAYHFATRDNNSTGRIVITPGGVVVGGPQ